MKKLSFLIIPLFIIALMILSGCFYTVSETEQVIITEFGKPVGQPINSDPNKNESGLHFKKPFIQSVNRIEKRILEWDGPATDMATGDKLYITVDNFARWRIVDPVKYFVSLRDERSALSRLDDIIGSETRSVIAKHDLIEVVRSTKDRVAVRDMAIAQADARIGQLPPIKYGRDALDREIIAASAPKVKSWGIELLDVRFKRINYKKQVAAKIYERMISEREQIADRFRSEGAGEAAKINGRREKDKLSIDSEAYRKSQEIEGKADAKAMEIYSAAYNTSPQAASFYQFIKTLDTYKNTMDKDTTTIFSTNSELYHLLKKMDQPNP